MQEFTALRAKAKDKDHRQCSQSDRTRQERIQRDRGVDSRIGKRSAGPSPFLQQVWETTSAFSARKGGRDRFALPPFGRH
jgi:hypothetical protein